MIWAGAATALGCSGNGASSTCTPGALRCVNNVVAQCDSSGTSYAPVADCGTRTCAMVGDTARCFAESNGGSGGTTSGTGGSRNGGTGGGGAMSTGGGNTGGSSTGGTNTGGTNTGGTNTGGTNTGGTNTGGTSTGGSGTGGTPTCFAGGNLGSDYYMIADFENHASSGFTQEGLGWKLSSSGGATAVVESNGAASYFAAHLSGAGASIMRLTFDQCYNAAIWSGVGWYSRASSRIYVNIYTTVDVYRAYYDPLSSTSYDYYSLPWYALTLGDKGTSFSRTVITAIEFQPADTVMFDLWVDEVGWEF